jgi:hypothetical protein
VARSAVEAEARRLYEEACARLLYITVAAWTRWEDLAPEVQDGWRSKARRGR